jgi:hypothetical protein
MSHEKLSSHEPEKALKAYSTALPILSIVESGIPCALPATGTGKLDFSSFTRFRELWLWVERLLRRAIVLASRTCVLNPAQGQNEDSRLLWTLFSHYRTCSIYWPTKFKTEQRSTVAVLHLRALILRARILSSNSPDRSSLDADKPPPAWLSDARSVINEYRAILNICTRFPKAGERNTKVEDFVDLCVAVWEAGGAIGDHTSWVIDVSLYQFLYGLDGPYLPFTDPLVGYASHIQLFQDIQTYDTHILYLGRSAARTAYPAAVRPGRR